MTIGTLLMRVTERLEAAGINYMVVGSVAAGVHGPARTTTDVDIVIDPTKAQLDQFVASLEGEFYVSPEAARDAMGRRSLFNIIDQQTAWKADLVFLKDTDFDVAAFERRRQMEALGHTVYVQSAEDTILTKLRWAKRGNSERQVADARTVAEELLAEGTLDVDYLQEWSAKLRLDDLLKQVL